MLINFVQTLTKQNKPFFSESVHSKVYGFIFISAKKKLQEL